MRVVTVIYKKKGNLKVYGSLEPFFLENESYRQKEDKINYRLSRLRKSFEDEFVKISRKEVIRGKRNKKLKSKS